MLKENLSKIVIGTKLNLDYSQCDLLLSVANKLSSSTSPKYFRNLS
jgi:hypothetical protein